MANRLVEQWKAPFQVDIPGALKARSGPRGGEAKPIGELIDGVLEHFEDVKDVRRAQVRQLFVDNPRSTLDQLKAGALMRGETRLNDDDVAELVEIFSHVMWDEPGRYRCLVTVWLRDAKRRHRGNHELRTLFERLDAALQRGDGEQLELCS